MFRLLSLAVLVIGASAIQLGEEYWTFIQDGRVGPEVHSEHDLMTFPETYGWIAFWVDGTHDVFGHARSENGQICGYFVNGAKQPVRLCSGFRVLTNNQHNPSEGNRAFHWVRAGDVNLHLMVEAGENVVGRLQGEHGDHTFYGSANLDVADLDNSFYGLDPLNPHDPTYIHNEQVFNDHVFILQKN